MVRLVRAAADRNPPTLGGGGCQIIPITTSATLRNEWTASDNGKDGEIAYFYVFSVKAGTNWYEPKEGVVSENGK